MSNHSEGFVPFPARYQNKGRIANQQWLPTKLETWESYRTLLPNCETPFILSMFHDIF